jgi:hypothetical protein
LVESQVEAGRGFSSSLCAWKACTARWVCADRDCMTPILARPKLGGCSSSPRARPPLLVGTRVGVHTRASALVKRVCSVTYGNGSGRFRSPRGSRPGCRARNGGRAAQLLPRTTRCSGPERCACLAHAAACHGCAPSEDPRGRARADRRPQGRRDWKGRARGQRRRQRPPGPLWDRGAAVWSCAPSRRQGCSQQPYAARAQCAPSKGASLGGRTTERTTARGRWRARAGRTGGEGC